jgi:hypothetical protein
MRRYRELTIEPLTTSLAINSRGYPERPRRSTPNQNHRDVLNVVFITNS